MKILLNVIGLLAMIGGLMGTMMATTAVGQMQAAVGILTGCCALGLAKLIELGEEDRKQTKTQRDLERDYWKAVVTLLGQTKPAPLPPLPGKERYWLATGETIGGPHTAEVIEGLLNRGTVMPHAVYVLPEGGDKWLRFEEAFQVTRK